MSETLEVEVGEPGDACESVGGWNSLRCNSKTKQTQTTLPANRNPQEPRSRQLLYKVCIITSKWSAALFSRTTLYELMRTKEQGAVERGQGGKGLGEGAKDRGSSGSTKGSLLT